jgi:hypothetical protein
MYPYNRIKCQRCGKFRATQRVGNGEYWCKRCIQKESKEKNEN